MENNKFLEKYFAEEDRKKQLSLLKNYMLSLSPEALKKFMLEPLDFLEKALKSTEVSDERKKKIFEHLDEMIFLLRGKVAA
ncbi:MAG TPA: hypothetical protein ENJ95_15690 [Bacteroidetes bacterium]|nr:hypothetical protein [Bacteroidota bacterium]